MSLTSFNLKSLMLLVICLHPYSVFASQKVINLDDLGKVAKTDILYGEGNSLQNTATSLDEIKIDSYFSRLSVVISVDNPIVKALWEDISKVVYYRANKYYSLKNKHGVGFRYKIDKADKILFEAKKIIEEDSPMHLEIKDSPLFYDENKEPRNLPIKGPPIKSLEGTEQVRDMYIKFPHLQRNTANALLFHGANSSSLLAFTKKDVFKGSLIPTSKLLEMKKFPFGEVLDEVTCRSRSSLHHISTAFIHNIDEAFRYAGYKRIVENENLTSEIFLYNPWTYVIGERILDEIKNLENGHICKSLEKYYIMRLKLWDSLSDIEKNLVEFGFPILYAIKPKDPSKLHAACFSNIDGEILIEGGVKADEISAIIVPKLKIEEVKQLIGQDFLNSKNINVVSFEETFHN